MEFSDIVIEKFKTEEDLYLSEGLYPITPFLAFTAWKNKIFKSNKSKFSKFSIKGLLKKLKAGILIKKEKVLSTLEVPAGKGEDATVYALTKQQTDVLAEIYDKYKKKNPRLINSIMEFRKNILAPYQLIKRIVKQNSMVSSKNIWGMTKEQFISSIKSGLKKIEGRGDTYFDRSKELQRKIREIGDSIKHLEQTGKDFEAGRKPSISILSKIYKKFGAGEEEFGIYTPDKLRRTYMALRKNYSEIIKIVDKIKSGKVTDEQLSHSAELRKHRRDLLSGKGIDLTKKERKDFEGKRIGFNAALGKYFLRKEILKELKPDKSNVFRATYISIIKEMIKKAQEYKYNKVLKLNGLRSSLEFNKIEKRIWEKLPSVKTFSNDPKDYFQKVKETDFLERPIYIKRTPKLVAAEQQIENEIKRFERELARILNPTDLAKLKQYRLINNLISVRELRDPTKLFKTPEEIKKDAQSGTDKEE